MDYIAAGNVMLDSVRFTDGRTSNREHIGGPATFAYAGIRLFTDSVIQCSNVGADYEELFRPWIEQNEVDERGIKVVCDHCNHSYLIYNPDGTYSGDHEVKRYRSDWWQDFGYMKTSPEEIGEFTKQGGVKGLYLAQNVDYVFWSKLRELKKRDGFKMMWEIEEPSSYKRYMPAVLNALEVADMLSLNINEAQNLFEVEGEEACIRELRKLPVPITIFRVGSRGLYSITKDVVHYLPPAYFGPVFDPTGSGNTSTGSALYAYCEGHDPLMVGIMANIGSAQNIRQYGVIPDFAAVREESFAMAQKLYEQHRA